MSNSDDTRKDHDAVTNNSKPGETDRPDESFRRSDRTETLVPDGGPWSVNQGISSAGAGSGWLTDLALVAVLTLLATGVLLTPGLPDTLVWLLGIPYLLFFPGYAIISTLFPEAAEDPHRSNPRSGRTVGWAARFALSIVMSPILIAVIATVLSIWSAIALTPVVVVLSTFVLSFLCLAAIARLRTNPTRRASPLSGSFRLPIQTIVPGTGMQNFTLLLAIGILVGALAFVTLVPQDGDAFTEAYLVTDDDGAALDTLTVNDTDTFEIGIQNHENEATTYGIVTVLQEVDVDGTVTSQAQLDRTSLELEDGEETILEQSVTPTLSENELRVQVHIYTGEAPESTSPETADHTLQFWLTIADE